MKISTSTTCPYEMDTGLHEDPDVRSMVKKPEAYGIDL
jgi:hypothetical protein